MQSSPDLEKFCYRIFIKLSELSEWTFFENRRSEIQDLLLDVGEFISLVFHIHYPDWVKFGITILHIMTFNNCEFSENRCREGHTFLTCVNEIAFTCIL